MSAQLNHLVRFIRRLIVNTRIWLIYGWLRWANNCTQCWFIIHCVDHEQLGTKNKFTQVSQADQLIFASRRHICLICRYFRCKHILSAGLFNLFMYAAQWCPITYTCTHMICVWMSNNYYSCYTMHDSALRNHYNYGNYSSKSVDKMLDISPFYIIRGSISSY